MIVFGFFSDLLIELYDLVQGAVGRGLRVLVSNPIALALRIRNSAATAQKKANRRFILEYVF